MKKYLIEGFDWNLLHFFVALADSKNYAAAEKVLGIPYKSIHKKIVMLEESVGSKLVERHTKGIIKLTPVGVSIYNKMSNIFTLSKSIFSTEKEERLFNSLSIATTYGTSVMFLAYKLKEIVNAYPNVSLHINTNYTDYSQSLNENDISIYPDIKHSDKFSKRTLKKIKFGLYVSKDYFETNPLIKNKKDLIDHNLIGYAAQQNILFSESDDFLLNVAKCGLPKNKTVDFKVNFSATLGEFVACSQGLGVALLYADSPFTKMFNVKRILPDVFLEDTLYMYYNENNLSTPISEIYDILKK